MNGAIPISEQELRFAFWKAGANWLDWLEDFEFKGNLSELPVLARRDRYVRFIREYNLLRYCTGERRESLRLRLHGSDDLPGAMEASDGSGVDELAEKLRLEIPGFGTQRSLISKVAAFARPATFIAWDGFARRGLAVMTSGPADGNYRNYSEYLHAANGVVVGEMGTNIRTFLANNKAPTQALDAFVRRMLDVCLMVRGGRWAGQLAL